MENNINNTPDVQENVNAVAQEQNNTAVVEEVKTEPVKPSTEIKTSSQVQAQNNDAQNNKTPIIFLYFFPKNIFSLTKLIIVANNIHITYAFIYLISYN